MDRSEPTNPYALQPYLPLMLTVSVFGVYLLTMAPVVYLGDSGELTAAAFSLGIPHPSGFPLYCLLGKLFCMIPVGNIGFKLNLMSALFSALTVFVVYSIILKITYSVLSSAVAAAYFALTPIFWFQTVSAEVYSLHAFFVAVLIRLLWWWDENKGFHRLLFFVFITGLSFGNHMQTVMMAPPVLYIVFCGDRKAILSVRHFSLISLCFLAALSVYFYLPIRTDAGAAIHWGDPNSIERFFAHFTTKSYQQSYVFGATFQEYVSRAKETVTIVFKQYGVLLLMALWGWIRLPSVLWKVFFVAVIFFDLFYSVFLNLVSFEITPFTLPTSIVIAILLGVGLNYIQRWTKRQRKIGSGVRIGVVCAFCALPLIGVIMNYSLCNQSRNYTAYEHAVNIFRTPPDGSTILLDGDNNIFPVAYGRIVEGMGDGITLYDRHNVIFKWRPSASPVGSDVTRNEPALSDFDNFMNSRSEQDLYFASVNPFAVAAPQHLKIEPCGILKKVVSPGEKRGCPSDIWEDYATASFYADFHRDYMNREVASYFFFRKGESLWELGKYAEAMQFFGLASQIGYNDTSIHSDLSIFYTDQGLFEHARRELEKALLYHDSLSGVHNNWGYYYHKRGEYPMAIASFKKAIELSPENFEFHNNLGLSLLETGKMEEARLSFRRSLLINHDQPTVEELMKKHDLK